MSSIHLLLQGRGARAVPGGQSGTIPPSGPCLPAGWAAAKPWESAVLGAGYPHDPAITVQSPE